MVARRSHVAEAASLATGDCARAEQAAKMHRNTVRRFSEPHDAARPARLSRLFESPFTNRNTTGPLALLPQATLKRIINVLGEIKQRVAG